MCHRDPDSPKYPKIHIMKNTETFQTMVSDTAFSKSSLNDCKIDFICIRWTPSPELNFNCLHHTVESYDSGRLQHCFCAALLGLLMLLPQNLELLYHIYGELRCINDNIILDKT